MLSFTDTSEATPEVLTKKIGLETNMKDPGKLYLHLINLFAATAFTIIFLFILYG